MRKRFGKNQILKMEKLEFDHRNCEQYLKNDPNQQLKKRNLSIDLPKTQQQLNDQTNQIQNNPAPKQLTPFVNFLNFNDELKNQSPILFKEVTNPFAETFKQAALNPIDFEDQDNDNNNNTSESLNTPSIDLKCFEPSPKKFIKPVRNSSKLDLLISASNDQTLNSFNSQTDLQQQLNNAQNETAKMNLSTDKDNDEQKEKNFKKDLSTNLSTRSQTRTKNKRILSKTEPFEEKDNIPTYKVFLKYPDGSSVPIVPISFQKATDLSNSSQSITTDSQPSNSNPENLILGSNAMSVSTASIQQQISDASSLNDNFQFQNNSPKAIRKRNSTKKSKSQKETIKTTSLKLIKNTLIESSTSQKSNSQLTADLTKCESVNSFSTSSQSSQSSLCGLTNDNSNSLDLINNGSSNSTQSSNSTKSKPGRKSKNQPKQDPSEKKIRSLERNREAASRCRTKRKIWVNALEQKANELEQQNKDLHKTFEHLKREVQLLKSALLNGKLETNNNLVTNSFDAVPVTTTAAIVKPSTINVQDEPVRANSNNLFVLLAAAKKENNC